MEGKELHTWRRQEKGDYRWQHVIIDRAGNVYAIARNARGGGVALQKLSWDSALVWQRRGAYHHEVALTPDGKVLAVSSWPGRTLRVAGEELEVWNDYLEVLTPQGRLLERVSLFEVFQEHISPEYLENLGERVRMAKQASAESTGSGANRPGAPPPAFTKDVIHTNSASVISQTIPGVCAEGDILVSARNLNTIGVLSLSTKRLVWSWGRGVLWHQHHPTLLGNGNILVFDNRTSERGSRVLEVNPQTKETLWEYSQGPSFFSRERGSAQRLPEVDPFV
jgi:hypothetical protein